MFRSRKITLLAAAAAALAALVVAGCGASAGTSAAVVTPPKTASGDAATVGVADNGKLGKILVDGSGNTLYLFEKDSAGKSACAGACAAEWPPLLATGKPVAGTGLDAANVGTTTRSDGKSQVTYNGHPAYRYSGDAQPGDAAGQGLDAFGARWYAVGDDGNAVTTQTSGSSGGGGAYGY
jgi:predicted lipoprotein with Yx(FWY)xxD motif